MSYGLGVDIGTTLSAAAICRRGLVELVTLGHATPLLPSVTFLTDAGDVLVGDVALRQGRSDPERLARDVKRRLGDEVPIVLGGVPMPVAALLAELLRAVVTAVVTQEGGPPDVVVLTCPANWGSFKRNVFADVQRLAEVREAVVITEPEAAAVAYAHFAGERIAADEVVAVYDLGGGTFDATVLRRDDGRFEIVGRPEGIEHLGGVDFDAAVFRHVSEALGSRLDDLDDDDPGIRQALLRLRDDCRDAKEVLSSDTDVSVPVLIGPLSEQVRLHRAEFEAAIRSALDQTVDALGRALESAHVRPGDLGRILLVGGSSRIPLVGELLAERFRCRIEIDAHPKHVVAIGAALVAARMADDSGIPAPNSTPASLPDVWAPPQQVRTRAETGQPDSASKSLPPLQAPLVSARQSTAPEREPGPLAPKVSEPGPLEQEPVRHQTRRPLAGVVAVAVGSVIIVAVWLLLTVTR